MSKFNKTIAEIFGLVAVKGEVGIEVEMEGEFLPHENIGVWNYHRDPSLRDVDNAEYTLRSPVSREEVPKQIDVLFDTLKAKNAKYKKNSPNTSVHVHLNFQDATMKEVYTFLSLWYIVENTMVEYCGEERNGNLFCLRASDAEFALHRLVNAAKYGNWKAFQAQNELRYLAMNFTSLSKFGSLEVRSMEGNYSPEVLKGWIAGLLRLKDYAKNFESPPKLLEKFSLMGPQDFFKDALGDLAGLFKTKGYIQQLHDGMRLCQNVAYAVNWDKPEKKKLPLNEDAPVENPVPNQIDLVGVGPIEGLVPDAARWRPEPVLIDDFEDRDPEDF